MAQATPDGRSLPGAPGNQRLGRAQTLLESTGLPVEKVAKMSGFGTTNNLRHHFLKQIGITPRDYRKAFPNVTGQVSGVAC
jgi:transcriptional regulator GlxA family with amidase domain